MPLAVTHVLTAIVLVDIYRDYLARDRKNFTLHTIFIAGIGGIISDIDVISDVILQSYGHFNTLLNHGGVTHTPFFAALFLVPGLYLWGRKDHKTAMYFFVLAFGVMLHISLDFVLGGGAYEGIMWLFPFSTEAWKIHLLFAIGIEDIPVALDAVILILWLWHEQVKHRISDFI